MDQYVLYLQYICVFTTAIPFTLHYCSDLLAMVVCIYNSYTEFHKGAILIL